MRDPFVKPTSPVSCMVVCPHLVCIVVCPHLICIVVCPHLVWVAICPLLGCTAFWPTCRLWQNGLSFHTYGMFSPWLDTCIYLGTLLHSCSIVHFLWCLWTLLTEFSAETVLSMSSACCLDNTKDLSTFRSFSRVISSLNPLNLSFWDVHLVMIGVLISLFMSWNWQDTVCCSMCQLFHPFFVRIGEI